MKTLSLVIGILIQLCPLAKAQSYVAWVKHYGPENGLAHREVNDFFQDRQGFMWFGTKFGLSRFDGKAFTTFTKDRNGLDFDDISHEFRTPLTVILGMATDLKRAPLVSS